MTSTCKAAATSSPLDRYLDRVTHADCIGELAKLPQGSVDFVLTDPPFLARFRDREGRRIENPGNDAWLLPAFMQVFRVLKPDSLCVSFYGWAKAEKFLEAWKRAGFYCVTHLVWVKQYPSFVNFAQGRHEMAYVLGKGQPKPPANPPSDVLPWSYTGNKLHPTQKPVEALKPVIEAYCPPGGVVLDPFAGSGTTGIAARDLARRFILFEKEEDYAHIAQDRLAGKLPVAAPDRPTPPPRMATAPAVQLQANARPAAPRGRKTRAKARAPQAQRTRAGAHALPVA